MSGPRPLNGNTTKLASDTIKIQSDGTWKSQVTAPVEEYDIIVPFSLLHTMREIERWLNATLSNNLEFGMYLKGVFDKPNKCIIVDEDVMMLPVQEVSAGSIDFEPSLDDSEYNGVIHRHPGSMHTFSGTDEAYINSNFEFSMIYANKEIKTGIVNIPTEYGRLRLPLNIEVDHPCVDISRFNLDNITEKVVHLPPVPNRPVLPYQSVHGFRGSLNNGHYTPPPDALTPDHPQFDETGGDAGDQPELEEINEELHRQWQEELGGDDSLTMQDLLNEHPGT